MGVRDYRRNSAWAQVNRQDAICLVNIALNSMLQRRTKTQKLHG